MKHLPLMLFSPIDHKLQRYDTAGDYVDMPMETYYKGNIIKKEPFWRFYISKMGADYEFLVLIHELCEWYLTQNRGISEPSISKFDTKGVFKLDPKNADDPGVSKFAPYHAEHMFATKIEKLIAKELGVDWKEYDRQFEDLVYKKEAI